MPVTNAQVAAAFDEVADLLEIQGANPFRVRAYRNAARIAEGVPRALAEMVDAGEELTGIEGIGADLAGKIGEMVRTGRMAYLDEARAKVPQGLVELLRLPGLGPKRVKELHEKLDVRDVATLRAALEAGRVRQLKGFGAKLETRVLEGLARHTKRERRFLLPEAEAIAQAFTLRLGQMPGVKAFHVAGSFRRRRESVGDLDLLVSCADAAPVMDAFVMYDEVEEVLAHGGTKASVRLRDGMQVDLRVVAFESHGAALHYFTGSKAHNIAVRRRGIERGLKINEYGVFRVHEDGREERVGGATEDEVFASVDLPWIPPELREDRGEIVAAEEGRLPGLVRLEDIRGDLQSHTTASDGRDTLEAMARAAQQLGHEYLTVTDHSPRLAMAQGLDEEKLREQHAAIDELNAQLQGFRVLKGIEVDILKDGTLDLPDDALAACDIVVASVHTHLDLPRDEQTRRILRAMEHPHAHILGHPTGRLLERREPMQLDMERLVDAAAQQGWALEINAQPDRLDLNDQHARMAKERGVKLAISTDAHLTHHLAFLRYGVEQARRAWLEKEDVLNARSWDEVRRLLRS